MAPGLCRDVAHEAVSRGARSNPHELWAALELVADLDPRLIVDLGSGPAVWWAWWMVGADVIGASLDYASMELPSSIVRMDGDARDPATWLRLADQVAGRPVDVLVVGGLHNEDSVRGAFTALAPSVRPGGLVLVHGIANRRTPGVAAFWHGLDPDDRKELIGSTEPAPGYGVLAVHGREREDHG